MTAAIATCRRCGAELSPPGRGALRSLKAHAHAAGLCADCWLEAPAEDLPATPDKLRKDGDTMSDRSEGVRFKVKLLNDEAPTKEMIVFADRVPCFNEDIDLGGSNIYTVKYVRWALCGGGTRLVAVVEAYGTA